MACSAALDLLQRRLHVADQLVRLGLRQHAPAGGDAELELTGIALHVMFSAVPWYGIDTG
jgi:hypothetical protein